MATTITAAVFLFLSVTLGTILAYGIWKGHY